MESFFQDVKQSLRMFWQSRGFTAAAVAALALGIGANTAIFSVVNAVLLVPVPFPEPGRLVMLQARSPQGTNPGGSPAKFQHWREQTTVLKDVAAFRTGVMNYTGGAFPEQLRSGQVSADFFKLFGVKTAIGRTFSAAEDLPQGDKVAILSFQTWTRRFDSDPNIIGKTISLSSNPYVVIGVIDGSVDFRTLFNPPEVWTAFQFDPNTKDQGHYFRVAGRLADGVSLEQANARLQLSSQDFNTKFPRALGQGVYFAAQPIKEAVVSNVRSSLMVLVGAVSFVLLIACANVANLLLVRATGRRREIAVRAAIGAGRGRLIRQLLTESVMLSLAGGVLGSILGVVGIRALLAVNTAGLPRVGQDGALVGLDWRVLLFTLAVSVGTGILFGLIPAFSGSRADLSATLKESSGRSGTGFRQNKARSVLVVVEVSLALILLIGSALLIRTAVALGGVDPGFDVRNVIAMRMSLTGPRFQTAAGVEQMVHDGVERVKNLPGVVAASATCCVPLAGGYGLPFVIPGRALPADNPFHGGGSWVTISPGYFDVFKIPVKRGRAFTDQDTAQSPPVVIINETLARRFFENANPLDHRLVIGRGVMREFASEGERQIIAVVGDVRDGGLNNDPGPMMYIPQAQVPDAANALNVNLTPISWVVRTQGDPVSVSQAIQNELRQASGLPVSNVQTLSEIVAASTSRQRFNMWLMTVFGGCALLLAAIGIYGLMAYSVQQRTQEIGIRLALGAQTAQVKRMVVFQGMLLAVVGLAIGLGVSFWLATYLTSFSSTLYGVRARDPLVFIGVPLILTAVALLAVWIPAQRASRVDPIIALRYE
jgi:putative ABC transport system permease protein